MQRCTGPCGRLLLVSDFPRRGFGKCWDCFTDRDPTDEGLDKRNDNPRSTRRTGARGF